MIFATLIVLTAVLTCQSSSELDKVATANNEFAIKLYKSLRSDGNAFFSPASIFIALGMLYKGAGGETAHEMRGALSYDTAQLTDDSLHQQLKETLELFRNASDGYTLQIANAIVSSLNYPISENYKKELNFLYNAKIKEVDFQNDKNAALNEVNAWAREETRGKIPKLFEDLDRDTVMVLLNAIYFKGTWDSQFNENFTIDDVFFANGKNPTSVRMMRKRSKFLYSEFSDFSALNLPYKGNDLSMLILLPKEKDGLKELEEVLTLQKLSEVTSLVDDEERRVDVSLPKFKLEDKLELIDNLKQLGMQEAFIQGRANLTGIDITGRMVISDVVHKAVIEVNEEGSEAAAVTGVVGTFRSGRPLHHTFKADHPFLFFILDKRTRIILFVGRVNEL